MMAFAYMQFILLLTLNCVRDCRVSQIIQGSLSDLQLSFDMSSDKQLG